MGYSEVLYARVKAALAHISNVEEKKMFGGICFMVNGKMCITVGHERLMCRIDPANHERALKKKGCRTVVMKGREYKGYVHINQEGLKTKKDLDFWIGLALEFNQKAKASKKSRAKT